MLVDVGELAEGSKEIISRNGCLTLEEGEPEDLSVLSSQVIAYFLSQIVVHNILEVYLIQVVSPWMQNGEAFVLDALITVLLDIGLEEVKTGLISVDRVSKVILVDRLLGVTDEGANSLDARA